MKTIYLIVKVGHVNGVDTTTLAEVYSNYTDYTGNCIFRPSLTVEQAISKGKLKDQSINTWLWDNGTFVWDFDTNFWKWSRNKESLYNCKSCTWSGKRVDMVKKMSGTLCPKCYRVLINR